MAIVKRVDHITAKAKQRPYYSDIPSQLSVRFGTKDVLPKENEEAVKQAIVNLLLTNRGERLFKPTVGSDIRGSLFENMDPATASIVKKQITTTIEQYEPRANLMGVEVSADPDTNGLVATIVFSILNKKDPVTLDVLLNRVR